MKCSKCGSELRLGSEEYCKDVQGRPMYRNFAYCDKCKSKTPLGYNRPYIGHSLQNQTNFSQPPQKIQNFFRYAEIVIGIISLLGCIAGIDSTSRGDSITGMIMIIFFGLVSFLFLRKSNRDKYLDSSNKYMNTLVHDIQLKEHELKYEADLKENELNDIRSQLDSINGRIETTDADLKIKTEQLNELNNNIESKEIELKNKNDEIDKLTAQITEYQSELSSLENNVISKEAIDTASSLDYTSFDSYTSEECKNELTLLRQEEKDLIKANEAVQISSENSKKQNYDNSKQILRCFNAECDNIILSITVKNIDSLRNKIIKSFDTLNKIFAVDGVSLSNKLLEFKLKELTLLHTFEQKRENEREIQKSIKEQMLEEERVRRELEKRKNEIEKDQKQFNNEVNKLMKYLQKTNNDIEKQLYADKIKELEERIKTLESEKADVINREQNAKAGFVYIISNIGSFGENIYKIGMTRRLEPMDRIKELSSASVPFEFDVHAMIFSEDAPTLESSLHQHFDDCRVNKINPRKEFFNISIDEIEQYVIENCNDTVEFTKIPLAKEYRDTQALYKGEPDDWQT